jgi:hypothetical protein
VFSVFVDRVSTGHEGPCLSRAHPLHSKYACRVSQDAISQKTYGAIGGVMVALLNATIDRSSHPSRRPR